MASNSLRPNQTRRPARSRRRVGHSCDGCYRRKIKCDAADPKCEWCFHHDLPCTYTQNPRPARRNNSASPHSLSSAGGSTESEGRQPLLKPLQAQDALLETAMPPSFAGDLHFAGHNLAQISTFNGLPFFSASGRKWVKDRTGQEPKLDRYYILGTSWQQEPFVNTKVQQAPCPLPDLSVLLEEINAFKESPFSLFFPIINFSLFEYTIRAAYYEERSTTSPGPSSARASIFAFLSLCCIFVHGPKGFPMKYGDEYGREAYRLLPKLYNESVTLDGLQTMLMLGLCSQALTGDLFALDHILSVAARFLYHFKANLSPTTIWEKPSTLNAHARTLFWITYVCDKAFSLGTGLPPALEDNQCDLTLPSMPSSMSQMNMSEGQSQSPGEPIAGSYLHISAILAVVQSRIYRNLYSPMALRQSDADLLRTIRDLDHSVEEWKESVPKINRPTLSLWVEQPGQVPDIRSSIFQLQYHHCMAMIHQASSRCSSWVQNQDTCDMSSSLAISVTASRSLLQKFLDSQLDLGSHNLMFSLTYFIQAIITLFCNLLSRPLDQTCHQDMYLIAMVPQLIRANHMQQLAGCYSEKINFAEETILELKRLAQCAIDKAVRERDHELSP